VRSEHLEKPPCSNVSRETLEPSFGVSIVVASEVAIWPALAPRAFGVSTHLVVRVWRAPRLLHSRRDGARLHADSSQDLVLVKVSSSPKYPAFLGVRCHGWTTECHGRRDYPKMTPTPLPGLITMLNRTTPSGNVDAPSVQPSPFWVRRHLTPLAALVQT
jgi:hypothetical protein